MAGSTTKDRLIDTALEVFLRNGYRASGISQIIAEADVSKMTLYHHFKTKDDLILAALDRYDGQLREGLVRGIESGGKNPEDRLAHMFQAVTEMITDSGFRGCAFIRACAEFPEGDHPVYRAAVDHVGKIRTYLAELCGSSGMPEPARTADQLVLLYIGAVVACQVTKSADYAVEAQHAAKVLLSHAKAPG